jgi:hypothetical protein
MTYSSRPTDQEFIRDQRHLRILARCWNFWGSLAFLASLIPLGIMVIPAIAALVWVGEEHGTSLSILGIGSSFLTLGLLVAACWIPAFAAFETARSLTQRRHKIMICVIAGLACVCIPWGTVLGVFTFAVLSRPSVQTTFR